MANGGRQPLNYKPAYTSGERATGDQRVAIVARSDFDLNVFWRQTWVRLAGAADFSCNDDAEEFLTSAGFSIGSMQRGESRGIMFGDYTIAKWRNLTLTERHELHGVLTYRYGTARDGDAVVTIWNSAPDEARAAIAKAEGRRSPDITSQSDGR